MKNFSNRLTVLVAASLVVAACNQPARQELYTAPEENTPAAETPPAAQAVPSAYDVTGKDTITTASGLQYIMVAEGTGNKPTPGKTVMVHYTGYLTDGSKFDSSVDRGEPLRFPIGMGKVIRGWEEGIALMNVGSRARLIIPHELAYGAEGYPPVIPPMATLIFDVELVGAE